MGTSDLAEHIQERKSGKDSVEDQVKTAEYLWSSDYPPTGDGIKKSELKEELMDEGISLDHRISTVLEHLRDIDIVRRWIRGPQILVIHDEDGVINGQDLEPIVESEINSLISAMQDDDPPSGEDTSAVADGGDPETLRSVLAEEFGIARGTVEKHLRTGDVPQRMDRLDSAIEAIEESDVDKNGEYHSVFFIHNPYRYSLTGKAVSICET